MSELNDHEISKRLAEIAGLLNSESGVAVLKGKDK